MLALCNSGRGTHTCSDVLSNCDVESNGRAKTPTRQIDTMRRIYIYIYIIYDYIILYYIILYYRITGDIDNIKQQRCPRQRKEVLHLYRWFTHAHTVFACFCRAWTFLASLSILRAVCLYFPVLWWFLMSS